MRFLLALSSLFLCSQAILNGRSDEWSKYGHLVKILSRSSPSSLPVACTGTLISPRLVLTASDCVMDDGIKVSEVMVSIGRPMKPAIRKRASIVEVNGTVAFLSLAHPIPHHEICPNGIPSDRVAHLSIVPSLTQPPITAFDWEKIDSTTCRIVAFKSMDNVDEFLASSYVETAVAKVEVEEATLNMRRTNTQMPAPCFEDAGAPFECLVGDQFIQVGLLSSLFAADDGKKHRFRRDEKEVSTTDTEMKEESKKEEKEEKSDTPAEAAATPKKEETHQEVFSRCLNASSLRFSRLSSSSVAAIIEKHDFSGFVKMHEACRGQQ